MSNLEIFEEEFWKVTFRRDSRFPGSLIVSAKSQVELLSELGDAAIAELGMVLAKTEKLLVTCYAPFKVIMAKMGFSKGFGFHFHMIPATLELIREIEANKNYTNDPDGNDALLYVSREYGERELTPGELSWQLDQVGLLRKNLC